MGWELPDFNNPEYKALDARLDYNKTNPIGYWDPADKRWEDYATDKFRLVQTALPQTPTGGLRSTMIMEVMKVGSVVRALRGRYVWSPRDGRWYEYTAVNQPAPSPPPDWVSKMNAELAALERANLTPEERQGARQDIIDSYVRSHGK